MKKNIFLAILFFLGAHFTYATIDIQSTFYTTNDGLGNNFVRHIYQDSKGFMWFSTINGLTRYDGHSFVYFQPGKESEISLLDPHVRNVEEDKNQFLWIQLSPESFSCYDLRKEQFIDYTGTGDYRKKFANKYTMSNGDTWLSKSEQGCRRLTYINGKYQSFVFDTKNKLLPSNNVTKIIEGPNHNVFIGTDNGLVKYADGKTYAISDVKNTYDMLLYHNTLFILTRDGIIYQLKDNETKVQRIQYIGERGLEFPSTTSFRFHDNWIILTPGRGVAFNLKNAKVIPSDIFNITNGNFVKDNKDNVCIFNDKGLIRFINNSTGKVKEFQIKINDLASTNWCKIVQDSRGWEWFATFGDGLYVYNPYNNEITHFSYQVDANNFICSNSLTYITEDRSGAIWLASESAGIARLNIQVNNVSYLYPENKSLINNLNSVRLIHQLNNGEVWIGNRDGDVFRYDAQLKKQLHKSHYESSIYAIQEDTDGKLMIGSRSSGMFINNQWITKGDDPHSLPSEKISLFFKDYKERIWVGTFNGGLSLMTSKNGSYTFRRFFSGKNDLMSVRSVASDKNNWMWVGTDFGLYVFHPDSLLASPGKYYKYNYDNGSLLANRVKYVFCDSKNRFWLGTMGGGISCCIPDGNYGKLQFVHYTTNNGLTNNVVQSIIEDQKGKIWVATEYGISRITAETHSIENFFFSKTIQGNVYNESSALRMKDNRLLFGTYHGVVVVDPQMIKSPKAISHVVLTDLKVNGISMHPNDEDSPLSKSIAYSDQIELKYYQSSIIVEFSTFDFSTDKKAKYSYKLEPYDTEWSNPSALNFASYKKLPAGTYYLRVKASNSAGIWSQKEAKLKIIVSPPFWASTIAYIFYFVLIIAISYSIFQVLNNFYNLRKRLEIEHQLTDYKLMFFTNISHEFRTPLTLIKGVLEKMELVQGKTPEISELVKTMSKSTNRLLRLINQLLEFRKMQHNKLSLALEETEAIAFFQEIYRYFEELASDKKIDYRFITKVPHLSIYLDKSKVDKMLFNLLSNAFKYTPNGGKIEFTVQVNEQNKQLLLTVSDSGVGIPKEKQKDLFSRFMQSSFSNDSVGIGLHLTQELVTVHKGNITYTDKPEGGSEFTIFLPYDSTVYTENEYANTSLLTDELNEKIPENSEIKYLEDTKQTDDGTKRKILLIEDDIDINKFLAAELSQYFDVSTAFDGTSGLEAAQTFDGDLIICDVLMPGMNGYEVTRNLKDNFDTCHIPVILLTAMSSPENQMEGTKAGADAYITKPFSPKLLLARISQLIKQRELLRSKFSSEPETTTSLISVSEIDQRFVDKLNLIMENQLENPDFSIDEFADKLHLGRTSFFRKVKGITGYTPNEYMRIYRLKKAMEFLKEGKFNVSEVSFRVGINDPLYFSRCFRKQFGVAPSLFLRGNKEKSEE